MYTENSPEGKCATRMQINIKQQRSQHSQYTCALEVFQRFDLCRLFLWAISAKDEHI
jgi:hypothetical protein